ncbi:hypothetical protein BB558_002217 [Smittium angustum]|uniref:leucine--tRNA ligase n=1 Tax=Smittium angustum TaxID=133377 RepID=A0A2U1J990_SMIAN|nr:hypothetical protein BB558_002217 [Smittium angustum]
MSQVAPEQKFSKRDALRKIELGYQKEWKEKKIYQKEAPKIESENEEDWKTLHDKYPKYMATFPFPYMNGSLHLGHSFSFSKAEFSVRFQQLKGKNALFPFGLHATGMPIKASADKISHEISLFGKDFSGYYNSIENIQQGVDKMEVKSNKADKAPKITYQFQIMESLGFSRDEIYKFSEPQFWLDTFAPLAIRDVTSMGCCVDWRRSFITTDANPFFDSFARWQFQRLRDMDKIKFGKRYTIWSIKDGQPCMDHDRVSGEGVGPVEYTVIKLKVIQWSESSKATRELADWAVPAESNVFLVAATMRPETMYGQTNCFVGVNIQYGAFDVGNGNVFIMTERAAKNMSHQGNSAIPNQVTRLGTIKGSDLVGTKVSAPLTSYDHVYVLPMDNVLATKGTGVVTSVPSDAPADYVALRDLQKKPEYYGIDKSWVEGYEPIDIIKTNLYGTKTAKTLVETLKIQSQKDTLQLEEAKDLAYKEGFYNGVMIVGKYAGTPAQEAKILTRADLIESGEGLAYAEPENAVTSRSGDDCIVALCDQWYIDYGEPEWRNLTESYLKNIDTGSAETRHQFNATLGWLNQWACARSFGLGTKVPWDDSILIESLSDSTIYMAYYTVSHLLHPNTLDGSDVGPLGIAHSDMDYEAWDYVLLGKAIPESHPKYKELRELRKSFLYWYPMDLRTSGKDLIQNHLTFCLYNHSAIFPAELQPRAIHGNGHLMLNGNKMSKSTGNFMTLSDSILKYGADATRISLADAGDGLEDANFEMATANASILRLYSFIEWAMGVYSIKTGLDDAKPDVVALRSEDSPLDLFDTIFLAMIDDLTIAAYNAYEASSYRLALKNAFYEMLSARDWYREVTTVSGLNMHKSVLTKFISRLALIMVPITPHWSEHLWTHILGNKTSILNEVFSVSDLITESSLKHIDSNVSVGEYIKKLVRSIRDAETQLIKQSKAKKLKTVVNFDPNQPKSLIITVSQFYPKWQDSVVEVLKANYNEETKSFDDAAIKASLGKLGLLKDKKTMPFANEIKKSVFKSGVSEFDRKLHFNESDILNKLHLYISKAANFETVETILAADESQAKNATPGSPSFTIANITSQ